MEKIVYILGAGFSAPLGLPVMSNFYKNSKDMYFKDAEKYKYFKMIFDRVNEMSYCKTYYDTNLLNIEEILSILEMKDIVSGNSEYKENFINYLCDVINHYTPEFKKLPKNLVDNLSWYKYLFGQDLKIQVDYFGYFVCSLFNLVLDKHKVDFIGVGLINEVNSYIKIPLEYDYSVITLNYDMILENLLQFIKEEYKEVNREKYGFNRVGNSFVLNCPWLVKLHGSVEDKEIIAPTWNKFLKPSKIIDEWKKAYVLLKEANQIRIIGYSLPITDSYIKYLLRTALVESENKHLKNIDVICKDSDGSVKKRYRDFINYNDFRFNNSDCIDYLKKIYENSYILDKFNGQHTEAKITFNHLENVHEDFFKT